MHFVSLFVATILSLFNLSQLAGVSATFFDIPLAQSHATLLFGGDMMFDRSMRIAASTHGGDFLFSCIDPVLKDSDLTIANLEGPITDNASLSVGSAVGSPNNFVFTFPRTTASLLKAHHIDMVNLGNNHILNFGGGGVVTTMEALKAAHVLYFGDPLQHTVATTTINGVKLALINYNEFDPQGAKLEASTTISQIKAMKQAGYLPIVYTHWGVEYLPTASQYVHDNAHAFVDAGAIAVIGSHPHVVEDKETYKGVPIYYSLGNFIFDQYFEESVMHGLFLKMTLNKDGVVSTQEIPIGLNRDRTVCPTI